MNISGFVDHRGFDAAIKSLPQEIKKQLRREMKDAADIIVRRAKQLAPVDTGHLKSMIRSRQAAWSRDGLVYEIVSTTIYNNSSAGPYPSFQEFGTVHNPAHPYLRPAMRESKTEVRRKVQEAVRIGMDRAVNTTGISINAGNLRALDFVDLA